MLNLVVVLLIIFASLYWSADGFADTNCPKESSATLISLQGKALVVTGGKGIPHEVKLNEKLCRGDLVSTQPNSRASLELPGNEILRLKEQTDITLAELNINTASIIKITKGFLNFISRKPKEIKIESGITNAMPLGTEFAFTVDESKASVWVYEGKVKVFNQYGSVIIEPGNSFAQVDKGHAPKVQIDIHPRDAVNWALYYPPLLPYPAKANEIDGDIRLAIEDYRHGQVTAALTRLDALPQLKQTPYFHKVRGAMRLTVGQDGLASDDINALLAINPNDAEALALQSVRALSQNHKEEAYTLANNAIKANPQSASAYSALSYAEQGRFQLEKALAAAKNATKLAPHDAMTFARQAELELALGLISDSEQSSQRALALDANLERTQTVMGFSHLISIDTDEALNSFNQAIQLDSTAPLPRLGLGLAKIRDGGLAEGRKDIEIAALLDPNNSLIRSYLGKAYYEENRNTLAENQFILAKERDHKDPTPFFYDALKKQSENRPVEALKDLQTAMKLNDNRGVYRSKQLLDADRAARGASLARVYDNLGFEQRGVVEATSSLQLDPTNYSAHRFLSDTYVTQQGRETAQLSELMQAKMLQPININPVQPHLSVSQRGLLNASGIANSSFQDFTRTFEGNRPQLLVSGVAGSQNSFGDEATISGIYNKLSYSLGQFHYGTDGVSANQPQKEPKNSEESHDIYDAFIQAGLTDSFDVQLEYLNRHTFLGNTNIRDLPGSLNENIARTGFHWRPTASQHWLGMYTYKNYIDKNFKPRDQETPASVDVNSYRTHLWEGQFIKVNDFFRLTAGFSYYGLGQDEIELFTDGFEPPPPKHIEDGFDIYMYSTTRIFDQINLTVGVTHDKHDPDIKEIDIKGFNSKWSPKFGLQWDVFNHAKLRLAYMEGYKKPLLVSQTLEPTHVAGFNQLFDDFNLRSYEFYGAALDFSWSGIFSGLEFNQRKIFSVKDNQEAIENFSEKYKGYLNFTINTNISLSTEYQYMTNYFYAENLTINTHKVPVEIRYFDPKGFFLNMDATWVLQNEMGNGSPQKNSEFVVFNAAIGFRLPRRLGIVSVELKNIMDDRFSYNNFSRFNESNVFNNQLEFFPQRTVLGRVTLNF